MFDSQKQSLRFMIKNIQHTAGQRHVIIFCPYWIVNYSQYALLLRESNDTDLPAGTVTVGKDGSASIAENKGQGVPTLALR